jgi:uncharacterized membrane protein YdjX (TVP38/TMEM64 family)
VPPDDRRARRISLIRLAAFASVLAAIAVVATLSGFRPSAARVRDYGEGFGALGPIVFVPLSTALGCLLVPGPILAGAAGLLFGTAIGTPVALAAAVTTAVAELLIARHVAGGEVGRLLPSRVRGIDSFIERRGFFAVLYVRLAPGIPYNIVNYGAGLTRLRVRDMTTGTLVGALPRTFAYVALGGSLSDLGSPAAIAALVLLVVTAVVGAVLARRQIAGEREGS